MSAALKDEWTQRRHVNRVRVRGYALAMCKETKRAQRQLEMATDRLVRARTDAEESLANLEFAMEQAELASRCFMSGDDDWIDEVAAHLEEIFG